MSMNLIGECKKYLPKFYSNGEWTDKPVVRFNNKYVEDEVIDFMGDLFHFLIESSFLNEHAIYWLKSNMPSVRKAFEVYIEEHDEVKEVNINTVQSDIRNSKSRLHKYFKPDMLVDVMAYPEKYLDEAKKTLARLMREFFDDREYRQSLVLSVPKEFVSKDLGDSDFEKLSETLGRYSKSHIREVGELNTSELTVEMVGYYNYLISNKKLSTKDKERLKLIREKLGLE